MAKIGKIRFVNFTYNDNRHIYDQTLNFYNGVDTLLNLQNGGGKTVLVQMMMQPVIPKQKLKDRLFKSYFTNAKTPVYIMIEWILDDSSKRVLTGIGIKKVLSKNIEDESDNIKVITFISEYEEESNFDIKNIELLEEERGIVRLIEFDKVVRNLSNAEKEGNNIWLFRWDLPDEKKEYARRLLTYKINQLEWKNLMVKINEAEAGLNSFFNDSGIKSTPAYAEYISDHASFPVGINITTGYKDIHILEDTIDILDIDFMENISEMLAKFLIKTSSDSIILGEKHDKIYDAIRREAKNMNFGEYKFIEVENKNYYVMGSNLSGAKDEVDQHFGNSFDYIPDKLGDLKLDKIEINAFRSNYFNTPKADEHQTNMIYKRKGLIRDINNINIFYQNSDNYDKVIIQFDSFIKDNDIERDVEEEISGQAFEDRPFIETKNKYYLNAAIEADGYDELTVKHEVSDKIFIIRIYGSRLEDKLDYIQKQKVESFIKENNIDDIILALVKTLSQ